VLKRVLRKATSVNSFPEDAGNASGNGHDSSRLASQTSPGTSTNVVQTPLAARLTHRAITAGPGSACHTQSIDGTDYGDRRAARRAGSVEACRCYGPDVGGGDVGGGDVGGGDVGGGDDDEGFGFGDEGFGFGDEGFGFGDEGLGLGDVDVDPEVAVAELDG
jgi:hypothetical protein